MGRITILGLLVFAVVPFGAQGACKCQPSREGARYCTAAYAAGPGASCHDGTEERTAYYPAGEYVPTESYGPGWTATEGTLEQDSSVTWRAASPVYVDRVTGFSFSPSGAFAAPGFGGFLYTGAYESSSVPRGRTANLGAGASSAGATGFGAGGGTGAGSAFGGTTGGFEGH